MNSEQDWTEVISAQFNVDSSEITIIELLETGFSAKVYCWGGKRFVRNLADDFDMIVVSLIEGKRPCGDDLCDCGCFVQIVLTDRKSAV